MLLVKVAILSLLHLQQVTINDLEVNAAEVKTKKTFTGPVRIRTKDFQRTYRGDLEVTSKNNELQLILTTTEEELVAATVSAESPPNALPAALEAQAILARSWVEASKGRHGQYDLCDTTHCQHFKAPTTRGIEAARATKGLVLTWQSKPFAPAYSSSCGGRTKTATAIGWNDDNRYPYFEVNCPICRRDEPQWSRRPAKSDLEEIAKNPNKEATRLAYNRRYGWDALPSNNYDIKGAEIIGHGLGHGLGYCQKGAAGLAQLGKTASEILRHYLPGTDIVSSRW